MCIKNMSDQQMMKQINRAREYQVQQQRNLQTMSPEAIEGYISRARFMLEKKRGGNESVYSLQINIQMAEAELAHKKRPAASRFVSWLIRGPR